VNSHQTFRQTSFLAEKSKPCEKFLHHYCDVKLAKNQSDILVTKAKLVSRQTFKKVNLLKSFCSKGLLIK
jgi:hypothetical protein